MSDHDPLCELAGTHSRDECCGFIDKVRADLYAKVQALRGFNRDGDGDEWVERSDVLAMLDGGSDG